MHRTKPRIYLVGETNIHEDAISQYLEDSFGEEGAQWFEDNIEPSRDNHDVSASENLIEVMGRACYRAWAPGLNPNVTKIREGNDLYIGNLLKQGHGSVLEHAVSNWIFADVSRVVTHELVRHRAGTAFSQESLRYVRLSDLGLWLPPEVDQDPRVVQLFETTFRSLEEIQEKLAQHFKLDLPGTDFETKKKVTSAMRRLAPIGLATTIGVSFNMRALRHVIAMRTAESAESEIRVVFDEVAHIAKVRWPNIFQDFERTEKGEWVTPNHKI